jgi:hypothetical protein
MPFSLDLRALVHRTPTTPPPDDFDLGANIRRWPPMARYLVAELERAGTGRAEAVCMVSAAWHNAGGERA